MGEITGGKIKPIFEDGQLLPGLGVGRPGHSTCCYADRSGG